MARTCGVCGKSCEDHSDEHDSCKCILVLKNKTVDMENETHWKKTRSELLSKKDTYEILIRGCKDPNIKMAYKKMVREINKVLNLKL